MHTTRYWRTIRTREKGREGFILTGCSRCVCRGLCKPHSTNRTSWKYLSTRREFRSRVTPAFPPRGAWFNLLRRYSAQTVRPGPSHAWRLPWSSGPSCAGVGCAGMQGTIHERETCAAGRSWSRWQFSCSSSWSGPNRTLGWRLRNRTPTNRSTPIG